MQNTILTKFIIMRFGISVFRIEDGSLLLFRSSMGVNRHIKVTNKINDDQFFSRNNIYSIECLESYLKNISFEEIELSNVKFSGTRKTLFKIDSFLLGVSIDRALHAKEESDKLRIWLHNRQRRSLESDLLNTSISILDEISSLLPYQIYSDSMVAKIRFNNAKLKIWIENRKKRKLSQKGLKNIVRMYDDILYYAD